MRCHFTADRHQHFSFRKSQTLLNPALLTDRNKLSAKTLSLFIRKQPYIAVLTVNGAGIDRTLALHQAQAAQRGLSCAVVERADLALDLDTPDDLAVLRALGQR